jgi:hypothetical protein
MDKVNEMREYLWYRGDNNGIALWLLICCAGEQTETE